MAHSTDSSSCSQLAREVRNLHQPGMLVRATLSPRPEDSCSDSVLSLRYCLLPFYVLTHTVVKRVHPVFGANNKPTSCVFAFSVSLPPRVRNVQHLCTFQLVQTDHAWSPVGMATDGLHGHHKNIVGFGEVDSPPDFQTLLLGKAAWLEGPWGSFWTAGLNSVFLKCAWQMSETGSCQRLLPMLGTDVST